MRRGALALLVLVGCATDDSARVRFLEADLRAKRVQLETLRRAGEGDFRLRDLRRDALDRARALGASMFEGHRAFVLVRQGWFQAVVDKVLPIKMKTEGFTWIFRSGEVELTPDGVTVRVRFQVANGRIKKRLGRPASGVLTGVLAPHLPDDGHLRLVWRPLGAQLDDKDFRAHSEVFKVVGVEAFEGLIPPLPVPLAPSSVVGCCGKRAELQVELSDEDAVVLRDGLLIPFGSRVDTVAAVPPPPPPEPPSEP